jgi:hypothetical protein
MVVSFFVQIVYDFLRDVIIVGIHRQPQPALLSPQHHRLALHPPYHVKRQPRLPPEGHLKEVVLNALLNGLSEFALDLKVPVRRA